MAEDRKQFLKIVKKKPCAAPGCPNARHLRFTCGELQSKDRGKRNVTNEVCFSKKLDAFVFPVEQEGEGSFLILTEQEGAVEGPAAIIAEFLETT